MGFFSKSKKRSSASNVSGHSSSKSSSKKQNESVITEQSLQTEYDPPSLDNVTENKNTVETDMDELNSPTVTAYPVNSPQIDESPSYNDQPVTAATAFVNEQVGKVRQLAEEGPLSFRVLAFLGGVAMIVTSVLDWIGELFGFSAHKFLISVYTFSFGIVICILEGRMFVPETHKYQQKFCNYCRLLKYVWGRGLFYFFAGTLQFSQMRILDMASGSFMIFVGIISLVVGNRTSKKLSQLSESIGDEEKLWEKFVQYDKDRDDYLEQADFAELVHDMGLSLDNNEHVAAFATIDDDDDQKISYGDLKSWWAGFNSKASHEVALLV